MEMARMFASRCKIKGKTSNFIVLSFIKARYEMISIDSECENDDFTLITSHQQGKRRETCH